MIAYRDRENPEKIEWKTPEPSRPIPGRRKSGLATPDVVSTPDPYDFHKLFTGYHI